MAANPTSQQPWLSCVSCAYTRVGLEEIAQLEVLFCFALTRHRRVACESLPIVCIVCLPKNTIKKNYASFFRRGA